ncbi:hypothetical protein CPAR01_16422 [Colletotrichum paranaense]|uniref:Uncharacterized protein n=11 Tax=Colletotrichum acutatum species complex TaxID=2707335 RepID=A0A010RL80_9PEZI|nr:uncharacterized protein HER10_EVM0002951 [Colletotrichum scovillei]XP_049151003.1 uncharacterized protein CLUP02_14931 [Colletotrichum lupini]XP_053053059.1 uncharacterized protein COL516b_002585 [Colletotrichum fioriniae]XP_060309820.1 uncharacterized protein CCOS01_11838 [Colletotrichum costaricense]XP_060340580.1 uncharacterized protein CPAR01_16422 [Colletotrichum paranaense]XP_060369174.1 uncharacterized protein BDZ83DRAFT_748572 [Colletotrichum acutatum]EXF81201.1 hypothetical protei
METSTTNSLIISLAIILAVFLGGTFAYQQGMLDPLIEQVGIMMFKAKAEAEKKKMQAQGMKAGQDFVDDQLKGNKQAADVADGIGSIGGLKKQL